MPTQLVQYQRLPVGVRSTVVIIFPDRADLWSKDDPRNEVTIAAGNFRRARE
jgi:hypothetical protein